MEKDITKNEIVGYEPPVDDLNELIQSKAKVVSNNKVQNQCYSVFGITLTYCFFIDGLEVW